MVLKGLVGLAAIAIVAYVAYFFWGQLQVASARATAQAAAEDTTRSVVAVERAQTAAADAARDAAFSPAQCRSLVGTINSDDYNHLTQDRRSAIYQTYLARCLSQGISGS